MNKITFEELKDGMRPFIDFPDVEAEIQAEIEQEAEKIFLSPDARNGGRPHVDALTDYLDGAGQRLKMVVGMSGGSIEKLQRVFTAIYPGGNFKTFLGDEEKRKRIASFLLSPDDERVFIPPFVRKSFTLPNEWMDLLKNREYVLAVIRKTKSAKYAVRMGFKLEQSIVEAVKRAGKTCAKGGVDMVDAKEVDVAVPDTNNPRMLIMSSYALTTASSQTTRANEQMAMYQKILNLRESRRRRGQKKTLFVNVIDGGGWLARSSDLEQLWMNCDYCFPHSGLDKLKPLLEQC